MEVILSRSGQMETTNHFPWVEFSISSFHYPQNSFCFLYNLWQIDKYVVSNHFCILRLFAIYFYGHDIFPQMIFHLLMDQNWLLFLCQVRRGVGHPEIGCL